ncbi:MAG TPA: F0F1 ATP synthase subunit gamma [Desulfotignum sp.]|nr:F0F1 ATP synthase subunit gamma [Desulfotignum sp.]
MQTLEQLKRRIDTTGDLHSVVRTMKSLAAVSIRQYEAASQSLVAYAHTLDMALGIVLRHDPDTRLYTRRSTRKTPGAVIFGSDQGMCGSLNEQVTSHALEQLKQPDRDTAQMPVICVGMRAAGLLEDAGINCSDTREVPGSVHNITPHVGEILMAIDTWQAKTAVDHVLLFHARPTSAAGYTPHTVHLLPIDTRWLEQHRYRTWDSTSLPMFTMEPDRLLSCLIREYLFISIFRAYVGSLASENAARLAAMQGAQKNIEELMEDLESQYNQLRQMSITEELLDIVSGFEALDQNPG